MSDLFVTWPTITLRLEMKPYQLLFKTSTFRAVWTVFHSFVPMQADTINGKRQSGPLRVRYESSFIMYTFKINPKCTGDRDVVDLVKSSLSVARNSTNLMVSSLLVQCGGRESFRNLQTFTFAIKATKPNAGEKCYQSAPSYSGHLSRCQWLS